MFVLVDVRNVSRRQESGHSVRPVVRIIGYECRSYAMPISPPYPCRTCGKVGCSVHHPPTRMRGRQLQQARYTLFAQQPLCVLCLAQGRMTVATVRDHIIALAHGGADDPTNTQALCETCNSAKSAKSNHAMLRDTPMSKR